MEQNLYKTDSRFQKPYEEFGQLKTSSGKSKKLKFNGLHLSKNYIPSPKTLFTDLSDITFNWLVVWRMTWGISQIFSRALKIGIWMGSFNPNLKKYELKIHRGIICHDDEELRKIWRGTDLSFQSWHEEFHEFWNKHLKVSKSFILMGSFWAKYILFELKKKYREVIFHETEEGYKIRRGIDLSFQNWHKEFNKFWPVHSKVSKIFTLMGSFWAKYVLLDSKSRVELSFMTLKSDAKFEEKLTCCLGNLANFHQSTQKCQNWNFDGILLPKVQNVWP